MRLKVLRRRALWGLIVLGLALLPGPAIHASSLWTEVDGTGVQKPDNLPDFIDLAAKLSPAVVNISAEQKPVNQSEDQPPDAESDPFDRFGKPFEPYGVEHPHSLGSGFIINK